MSDDDLPPLHAAYQRSSGRMGIFTPNQFTRLQAFWSEILLSKDIGCTMAFDSGHSHCRVTYQLTNPKSEDRDIAVALIEHRENGGSYKYTIESMLDGKLHDQQDVVKNIETRNYIPNLVIETLSLTIQEMNRQDFSVPLPSGTNARVVSLNRWKHRPK